MPVAALAQQPEVPVTTAAPPPVVEPSTPDTRSSPEAAALSFGAIADKILPSVVTIRSANERPVPMGSGFIVSSDGHVLTTEAIGLRGRRLEILTKINGAVRTFPATVVTADPATGAALLKIEADHLPAAVIGDSEQVRAGDTVFAAGAAVQPHRSMVQGSVTGFAGGEAPITTDIPTAPLDTGGPLVDSSGRVIGINIASRRGESGFAVPIKVAMTILQSLTISGAPQRGFLGIQIRDLTAAGMDPRDPSEPTQPAVTMIGADSPAERAGFEIRDVIKAIDGQAVADSASLRRVVSSRQPGDEVTIDVVRDGQPLRLTAVLEAIPMETGAVPSVPPPVPLPGAPLPGLPPPSVPAPVPGSGSVPAPGPPSMAPISMAGELLPGLTITNLTSELRQRHAIPAEQTGVVVTRVAADSHSAAMDIREGDLITQVNRKAVTSVDEARALSSDSGNTVLVKVYRQGTSMLFVVGR